MTALDVAAPPAAPATPTAPDGRPSTHAGRFRPELHGLRGLAIALVVLYHVFFDRVSGGIDVFLFISAFLLVGTFLRKVDEGRPLRPAAYWARTFTRLLPPTVVVVLATVAAALLVLPQTRWMTVLTDAAGSVLHVENWVLIRRGVDYYAAEEAGASAFQHFWSLSMQGQVFLVWPVLIALAVAVARWRGRNVRVVLAVVFGVVLLCSFAWSVHSTRTQQTIAYFDTFARLWEFAAGSLLGIALPWAEQRRRRGHGRRRRERPGRLRARVLMAWTGIAGLLSCGALLDVQGAFPGWIALWPLGAAALVLCAGTTGHRFGVDRLLAVRPAVVLADISYGLYLVHWPLLTLFLAWRGTARATPGEGLVLIAVSLALAWLLTRAVDSPIRRWPWAKVRARRGALVVALSLVVGLAPVAAIQQHLLGQAREATARAVTDNPGARVLDPGFDARARLNPEAAILPTVALAGEDWVGAPEPCTGVLAPRGAEQEELGPLCRVVPGAGPDSPVLISVGDSRMEQFSGALIPLAQREGWTLVTLWKGGCTFAPDAELTPYCDAFGEAADAYIARVAPEAIALATTEYAVDGEETLLPGLETTLPRLAEETGTVIAVRAMPRLGIDPAECVAEHGPDSPACAAPLPAALQETRPDAALLTRVGAGSQGAAGGAPAATADGGVVAVDPNPLLCPEAVCTPVIGNVLVFLDDHHLTGTYAASMQDGIDAQLAAGGFTWAAPGRRG